MSLQKTSLFLNKIPPEIRMKVYEHLFDSTVLHFADGSINRQLGRTTRPVPSPLAIFRTCRLIYEEAKEVTWLGRVLFNFETPGAMIQTLSRSEVVDELSTTRHVRVRDYYYCGLTIVLRMLPGLQLKKLTVLGSHNGRLAYNLLHELIQHGIGWRELEFITADMSMFSVPVFQCFVEFDGSRRSTRFCEGFLKYREGEPDDSFTVHRSTHSIGPGALSSRHTFAEEISSTRVRFHGGHTLEARLLLREAQRTEQLCIFVKNKREKIDEDFQHPWTKVEVDWVDEMTRHQLRGLHIHYALDELHKANDQGVEDHSHHTYQDVDNPQPPNIYNDYTWHQFGLGVF